MDAQERRGDLLCSVVQFINVQFKEVNWDYAAELVGNISLYHTAGPDQIWVFDSLE